jgi:capsular polysaccharide export protein
MYYSTSTRLLKRRAKKYEKYKNAKYVPSFLKNIIPKIDKDAIFLGWGYQNSGFDAMQMPKWILLEDGFIRSVGLGVEGYPAFSIVEDDMGMHYDANRFTRIEKILKETNFSNELIEKAKEAIKLIKKYKISKYNLSPMKLPKLSSKKKVLVIAQTANDNSLKYSRALEFSPEAMIKAALEENEAEVYVKIHPDVLSGKKKSSIDLDLAKKYCKVITDNVNPILLLEEFDKIYTQSSQMGFEAILLDKEVVLFGLPFYAGWGLSDDRIKCKKRNRKLTKEEVFAGAYILYSKYYNPYAKRECDIIETIEEIKEQRDKIWQNS